MAIVERGLPRCGGFRRRAWVVAFGLVLLGLMSGTFDRTASAQETLWISQFGGDSSDSAWAVTSDASSSYVAGAAGGAFPGEVNLGASDVFVRKLDVSGNELWTRQFGTTADEGGGDLSVDASGVYVVGSTAGILFGQPSSGGTDAFLRKYDPSGNVLWTRQFGSSVNDGASRIAIGASGVYVAGSTDGALPSETSVGLSDVFLRKYDVNGNTVWTRQFGTVGYDSAGGVAVDSTGVYVGGSAGSVLPGQTSAGSQDAFLGKFDANGNVLWTRQFGTSASDSVVGTVLDGSGIFVAGRTSGTFPGQPNAGPADVFIRKYDGSGNILWTRQFGSAGWDEAYGTSLDASGVYVSGATDGTFPGQTRGGLLDAFVVKYDLNGNAQWTRQFGGAGSDLALAISAGSSGVHVAGLLPSSTGMNDAFVRKYDNLGNQLYTQQFGSTPEDQALGIAVDGSGVYVAGFTKGAFPSQPPALLEEAFIRKYDASGNVVWTRTFGSAANDQALGIAVNGSGVYVAGWTGGTLPGETGAGGGDAFVRKYDGSGNVLWTRQFGSLVLDIAQAVAADASGVYVGGYTGGALPGQTSLGSADAFVRKYDSSGSVVWTRQFGSAGSDQVIGITADASGVYSSGSTSGSLPGETNSGTEDAFVVKFDPGGSMGWTDQFGTSGADWGNGIARDDSGVYVVGPTEGTLPGQTSLGLDDAFIRKYDSDGSIRWTRQFGTSASDQAFGITVDAFGAYVVGSTAGTLPGQTTAGSQDAFLQRFDRNGNLVWIRQFGSSGFDIAYAVAGSGPEAYVAGTTTGALPGQVGTGGPDAFAAKIAKGDTTPPVLSVPPNLTTEATGPSGASVQYMASAQDDNDGSVVPVCDTPSGSTFPLGTTTVTCTATDSSGNFASSSFQVTVRDTTPPDLLVPTAVIREASGPDGANVVFDVQASDLVDGSPDVTCNPASGSSFPIGATVVECTASDSFGNGANASFTVTVRDTTKPTLQVPDGMVVRATATSGMVVTFDATAQDSVDPAPLVTCQPASGSVFPIGTTVVECTARDWSGNVASASFTVRIDAPEAAGEAGFAIGPLVLILAVLAIVVLIGVTVILMRRRNRRS